MNRTSRALASLATVGLLASTGVMAAGAENGTASGADNLAVQDQANVVWDSFGGTTAQRNAEGLVRNWALNGSLHECMVEHGFTDRNWAAAANQAPRTNALGSSAYFASPTGGAYSNALSDVRSSLVAEEKLRVGEVSADELTAVDACLEASAPVSDAAASAAATPTVVRELRDEWWSMISEFDAENGDAASYNECFDTELQTNHPNIVAAADSWQVTLAQAAPSPQEVPVESTTEPSDDWLRFMELEHDLETADWECREPYYSDHIDDLSTRIEQFVQDNAADIARAHAAWLPIIEEARELEDLWGPSGF